MKSIKLFLILLVCSVCLMGTTSCSNNEGPDDTAKNVELAKKAKGFLNGQIVLSTKVTMNGVDKTILPTGCPAKFEFEWDENDPLSMSVSILEFTVGKMPMVVNFKCNTKIMNLNAWEEKDYAGRDWFKFEGKNGDLWIGAHGTPKVQEGSSIAGFYNVKTQQINLVIDYNMMNISSESFLQVVDKSRIGNFEAEKAKYEEDLKKWKEEHGM